MEQADSVQYIAFVGVQRLAAGELASVVSQVKRVIDGGTEAPVLIFNGSTSQQIEVDFRGTEDDVLQRLAAMTRVNAPADVSASPHEATPRSPGRPKLGVVAREVTLLPRHWEWLNRQPGGASVALRKLVEQARRTHEQSDRIRQAQEATDRFMFVMAGDLPGYEEATRALYAKNRENFDALTAPWPADVREHTHRLASIVFQQDAG